jgi:hypothetical protein
VTVPSDALAPDEVAARVALDDETLVDPRVPIIVVDLARGDPAALESVALASLPAVIAGVGFEGAGEPPGCVDVVGDPELVGEIRAAVGATPRSAVALALLLRTRRSPDDALVAESVTYSMLQASPEFTAWRQARSVQHVPPDAEPPVRWSVDDDTLHIVLNRPHRHNAVSTALRDHLVEPLRLALAEPTLRIIVSGAGPSFCSGGDLAEFGSFTDAASAHVVRLTRSPAKLLARLGDRVEARVHGACMGAGVEWAAFCGRVVARGDAVFALPELGLGLIPGAGGTVSLPARIGRHRTARLALTGERIDASTALAWGLVDELSD